MKKKYLATVAVLASMPLLASAQTPVNTTFITGIIDNIKTILNAIIPLFIGVSVVFFFWNIVKFVAGGADEATREESKKMMIWSLIAIVVMVSIWGLVGWLQSALGLGANPTITPPKIL